MYSVGIQLLIDVPCLNFYISLFVIIVFLILSLLTFLGILPHLLGVPYQWSCLGYIVQLLHNNRMNDQARSSV